MIRNFLILCLLFCVFEISFAKILFSFWNSNSYEKERLPDGKIRMYTEVAVLGETKIVEVIFTPNVESFAPQILENAIRIIPAVANYLQIAPKHERYTITHLIDKSTARNEGNTVLVPFNYPDPNKPLPVPLLFHEIDHWWFGHNPRFISEGVSSFLPMALAQSGHLTLTEDEMIQIQNWWGFFTPTILKDRPLGDDDVKNLNGDESFSLFYQKSYKIQYILYKELGAEGYLSFLKSLKDFDSSEEHFVQTVELGHQTEGILTLLNEVKAANWKQILSGWILSKNYSGISINDWLDTDNDGLLNIEEKYIHTNHKIADSDKDGLNDGAEVQLGTNPLVIESKETFERLLESKGPVLDGNVSDWNFIRNKKTVRANSNLKIPGHFDLIEFQYFLMGDELYGALKTRDLPKLDATNKGYYYFFVDSSESPKSEGFGFWYGKEFRIGWEIRKESPPEMVTGKVGDVFEFKIRIPKNDPIPKKYIPIIRKTENIGIWNNYTPIEIER